MSAALSVLGSNVEREKRNRADTVHNSCLFLLSVMMCFMFSIYFSSQSGVIVGPDSMQFVSEMITPFKF